MKYVISMYQILTSKKMPHACPGFLRNGRDGASKCLLDAPPVGRIGGPEFQTVHDALEGTPFGLR